MIRFKDLTTVGTIKNIADFIPVKKHKPKETYLMFIAVKEIPVLAIGISTFRIIGWLYRLFEK
ncbi:MAG: hypothetical protein JW894_00985 [Bacteroidales bacterium]|nr:hypothetical protein [Bacteroidales bacterium]